jgi:uncharacterized membrane protein YjgN (DUF898 family)
MEEIQYADTAVLRKPPPAPSPYRQLSFHGDGSALFGITLVNLFLTIVTLGLYLFWGKVRARNYVFGQLEFEGDRFGYHATGKELLIGWLQVAIFLGLLYGAQNAANFLDGAVASVLETVGSVVLTVVFLVVLPIATVASRRFRLSRTSWRGIRFSFRGRSRDFLKLYLVGTIRTALTVGLYYPFFTNDAQKFLMRRTYFGNTRFEYNGEGRGLFKVYLLTRFIPLLAASLVVLAAVGYAWSSASTTLDLRSILLAVIVAFIGLSIVLVTWPVFTAARDRYVWSHTSFATARFRSTVTAGRLYGLYLGDMVRLVPTLALALPWVVVRHVRFRCANLVVEGPLDLAAIQQEAQAASPEGAGLGDSFGILDFDLGL